VLKLRFGKPGFLPGRENGSRIRGSSPGIQAIPVLQQLRQCPRIKCPAGDGTPQKSSRFIEPDNAPGILAAIRAFPDDQMVIAKFSKTISGPDTHG